MEPDSGWLEILGLDLNFLGVGNCRTGDPYVTLYPRKTTASCASRWRDGQISNFSRKASDGEAKSFLRAGLTFPSFEATTGGKKRTIIDKRPTNSCLKSPRFRKYIRDESDLRP